MRIRLVLFSALISLIFTLLSSSILAENKVIKMAYKDEAKPPLIGANGDNAGIYKDMFTQAAERIGYRLEIIRLPKKRLYLALEKGELDFYPGSSFSKERAGYLVFLANGLVTKEVLISRSPHQDVSDLSQLSGTLLIDLGGSKKNIQKTYPKLSTFPVASLDFEQSLTLLRLNRVDYYIADIEEVEHYAEDMGVKNYEELGLKIHHEALGGLQPMYMGFSLKSSHVTKEANSIFQNNKPLAYTNTPFKTSDNSVAFKLHQELLKMRENGELDNIIQRYQK